ncbi:hypothetical protein [Geobacillus sp. YF-1]|uniref:hypothetical protein n=1 Tax=Geobacillus sp. YF-1 TaxID=3457480 RepID=UPI004045699B
MDWYTLLVMACVLLLVVVPDVGRSHSLGAETFGLSKGVNALLLRLASGELLLFSCYAFMYGGVAAGITLAMAMGVAVFVLWRSITARPQPLASEGERWPDRCFTARALVLFRFLVCLLSIGRLLVVLGLCAYLLRHLFHVSLLFLLVWFSYVYVFTVLAGWAGMRRIGTVLLYIVYLVAGIIPFAYYLTGGVMRYYETVARTAPSLLDLRATSLLVLFFSVLAAAAGQWFADPYVWEVAPRIKKERVAMAFLLAGCCLVPLPLAMAALCIPYAAAASPEAIWKGWLLSSSAWMSWPLAMALLAALSCSLSLSLRSVVQLLETKWGGQFPRTYALSFLFGLALLSIVLFLPLRLVLFSTALLASVCFGLAAWRPKEKRLGVMIMIGWSCLLVFAWRWGSRHDELEAIAWNGIGSFLFVRTYRFIQKIKK